MGVIIVIVMDLNCSYITKHIFLSQIFSLEILSAFHDPNLLEWALRTIIPWNFNEREMSEKNMPGGKMKDHCSVTPLL